MTVPLELLLRLPPALRCQTLSYSSKVLQHSRNTSKTNGPSTRLFTNTSRLSARPKSKQPPSSNQKYNPTPRKAPPPPPAPPKSSSPKLNLPKPEQSYPASPYIRKLLATSDPILLYKSPSHTTFMLSSYIFAAIILFGAGITASNNLQPPEGQPKLAWWARAMVITGPFFMSVVGTTFLMGPAKMINTVSLMVGSAGKPVLRFAMKPAAPFMRLRKGGVIDVPLKEASYGADVKANMLNLRSIPLEEAAAFTKSHLDSSSSSKPRPSISDRLRGFNTALINAWPTLRQDTRRMFLRDSMVYVKIPEHGNWKLDLHHCQILENGRALSETMTEEFDFERGVVGLLKNFLRS